MSIIIWICAKKQLSGRVLKDTALLYLPRDRRETRQEQPSLEAKFYLPPGF